ncbi:MAG: hypothetical protein A2600_04815 [Candidatus Lambdaproteobacteria bacterium RIFOXYD1_FULL_56_27]|uniref:Cupin fold metalloprotein WbuC cupin domain-containing protein n=1 Tax=Candidatus Lambdaproteobacteria bacterium RIFOXYD2_FULL_56_26 TaxID=1817773 RepID=A0A1F6H3Y4_9PROT|nr:MAG: hypothetical protein A2426_13880 [Candidatus Lambdaproteobacteria bacterium RIFOXYC1_FULL_56_13]OGH05075.1 MAG: hypothetical protein A2557_08880 [Candidatus Lambdaproteobacteria bacterium RIFOXYD2_FULL_56_26]OGH09540.1 MAG: hypothetical protein A2600_04815 [Candidatus Lambdaproteobacteria bacterium RIFOXYD1_FULL_56_27]
MSAIKITRPLLDQTAHKARQTPRGRTNHNFHRQSSDPLQRLLNAIEPGSYVRPHRHLTPAKDEVFLCLVGRGALVTFDETGHPQEVLGLDPSLGLFGADIPAGTFHSILALQSGSVFYEVKLGPYEATSDKDFAVWAPAEPQPEAKAYQASLEALALERLGWVKG